MVPPLPQPPLWRWTLRDGLPLLLAVPLAERGIPHAFTTRIGGASRPPFDTLNLSRGVGDDSRVVARNRERALWALDRDPADHVEASQVHGREVAVVTAAHRGEKLEGKDGLVARDAGVVLAIHCADCVPLLLADRRTGAVAAVHTGWRGTAAGAAQAAVAAMRNAFATDPADLVAAIGPAVGPCCYEVDLPVYERFAGWPWHQAVFAAVRPGRWHLDLWEANRLQLEAAGVRPDAISCAGLCTVHHPRLFFSHRRDGRTGHMAALVAPAA